MTQDDKLLTTRQACAFLAVSQSTLLRLVQSGELNRVQIRRSNRYRLADLNEYVERCTVTAGAGR